MGECGEEAWSLGVSMVVEFVGTIQGSQEEFLWCA